MSAAVLHHSRVDSVLPLGSLAHATAVHCGNCDSTRVTRLNMTLASASVRFTACRDCGENQWHTSTGQISRADVFELARKR